ncbi:hypothetical protein SK224_16065, partial [Microbacterium sp. BG28]|uniref:hypothetical protein n=1 Tax=Microbacterium sp. BG28 TaxID=3097356 RepID=UPI002A5A00B7
IHNANPKGLDLIQRNLTQPKLERGYLAFDKCTLLSSQGTDAPTIGPLGRHHGATIRFSRLGVGSALRS